MSIWVIINEVRKGGSKILKIMFNKISLRVIKVLVHTNPQGVR